MRLRGRTDVIDQHGRRITYLRVSVTDRCDLRCTYCMGPMPEFLAHREVLSLEEIERICRIFIDLGIRKIRVTGGEPLLRKNVSNLLGRLGEQVRAGRLAELTMTTNGTLLASHAAELAVCGIRRLNVSLDSLDPSTYRAITGRGALTRVLEGVDAADSVGLRIKINAVVLPDADPLRFHQLIDWCGSKGFDLTLIEAMPMGYFADRGQRGLTLERLKETLLRRWTLIPLAERSGGPANYVRVVETGGRLGFIAPMTNRFCGGCNRIRLTCQGTLKSCLGRGGGSDLKTILRTGGTDADLQAAIGAAIAVKPLGHTFGKRSDRTGDSGEMAMHRVGG